MSGYKVIVDSREKELRLLFAGSKVSHEVQQLKIGDIIITNPDKSIEYCIIERKTHEDLASSHIDGRFRHQRESLKENYQNTSTDIFYIIEEFSCKDMRSLPVKTARSMFANLMLRDHIFCYHVPNVNETFRFVQSLGAKYADKFGGKVVKTSAEKCAIVKKTGELKNETSSLVKQLCMVPGVSLAMSQTIGTKYKNMAELIGAYNAISTYDKLTDKKKKSQKEKMLMGNGIGKITSKKIYENLFDES